MPVNVQLPRASGTYPSAAAVNSPPSLGDPNYSSYLQGVSNALNVISANLPERSHRRDDLVLFPKIDWQPDENDHLSLAYNYNHFDSPGGVIENNPDRAFGNSSLSSFYFRDHDASVNWNHLFNTNVLNNLHAAFVRGQVVFNPSGLIDPGLPAVELFTGNAFIELGDTFFARGDTRETQWELSEQVNYHRGRHDLKFGADFDFTHIADYFPGNTNGAYLFFGLTNFALGNWGLFQQTAGNATQVFAFPFLGFYVQDKWQATQKLTLNFGLREDFQIFPQQPSNPLFPLTGRFPNNYQRISPRLGFAYEPFEKTVVRGGFGIFYELFTGLNYEISTTRNGLLSGTAGATFFPSGPTPNAEVPTFPANLPAREVIEGVADVSLIDPSFKTPYVMSASMEVEREILPYTTVTVGTLWTHAVHQISSTAYDLNLFPPAGTTTYIYCTDGTISVPDPIKCNGRVVTAPTLDNNLLVEGRLTSSLQQLNALITPGLQRYNSGYVQLRRQATKGFALLSAYTYSKNVDWNGVNFNNQFDLSNTRENSLLDQRHRLSIAAVYESSILNLRSEWSRRLLSGWKISTVTQFESGRPYTSTLNFACTGSSFSTCNGSNDYLNNSAFNQNTQNTAGGVLGRAPVPGIGFNSNYGPWIQQVDLGVARNFNLYDRGSLLIQIQVFNLLNRANFLVQNGLGIDSSGYNPIGSTCGDGVTQNQTCYLVPIQSKNSPTTISALNGPRIIQFGITYKF